MTSPPSHDLGACCRCLTADLDLDDDACRRHVSELSDPLVAEFCAKRRDTPVGQEVIQALAPALIAYSLHSGRMRAATWHHKKVDVVWLLAAAMHRADDRFDDAYARFAQLFERGRLMPTEEDIRRVVVDQRSRAFATTLVDDLGAARADACANTDAVRELTLGGRVRLRLFCDSGAPPLLSVAISRKLRPGDLEVPPTWEMLVLAALFPTAPFEDLEFVGELGNGTTLTSDEAAYRYFA